MPPRRLQLHRDREQHALLRRRRQRVPPQRPQQLQGRAQPRRVHLRDVRRRDQRRQRHHRQAEDGGVQRERHALLWHGGAGKCSTVPSLISICAQVLPHLHPISFCIQIFTFLRCSKVKTGFKRGRTNSPRHLIPNLQIKIPKRKTRSGRGLLNPLSSGGVPPLLQEHAQGVLLRLHGGHARDLLCDGLLVGRHLHLQRARRPHATHRGPLRPHGRRPLRRPLRDPGKKKRQSFGKSLNRQCETAANHLKNFRQLQIRRRDN